MECESKSFCVLPWIHSFVNSNGVYQICCISEEHHHGILNKNGNFFNINDRPDFDEVMNSDMMKELRLKMLNGEWSKPCTRCFESEKNGGSSRRIIENKIYENLIPELLSDTKNDGAINIHFKTIDYRLGNKCNLQCRMCNPLSTSNWIEEWNEIKTQPERFGENLKDYYSGFDWPEKELLFEEFREKLDEVDRLHFAGGEPLLSAQMAKMLEECIRIGRAEKISLSYNTNATILPKNVLELWKHFKEVKLLCSVDGVGAVNEYIRFPSKWEIVDRNLHYLDQHAKELKISEIILSCTVQVFNVLSLKELFSYVRKFKNIDPIVNLVNLHYPEYYSTQALPVSAKEEATKYLQEILSELKENNISHQFHLNNIELAIAYMNEIDKTDYLVSFKKVNTSFDKKKNIKLANVLPKLNSHLMNYFIDHLPM